MSDIECTELFNKGIKHLASNDTLSALSCFEKAMMMKPNFSMQSYYAFCIAKERGQFQRAIKLCKNAIMQQPANSSHYLNLGKIYLLLNNKAEAINVFREGLNHETKQEIVEELNKLGTRKPPIIPFLKRSNSINKFLGVLLKLLKLR
ncbi:MAG: tetratricopeptide repeat protein [Nitrospirota bacterium]